MGPLLNFEDGLNPRIGSAFSARSSSISPIDFMLELQCIDNLNILQVWLYQQSFSRVHEV